MMQNNDIKIAILGAGITGLTAARLFFDQGRDVIVYESTPVPGGLAKTRITNDYTYDLHGGHVFNSKYPEIRDWVFSLLPTDQWKQSRRNAKILIGTQVVSYPLELSLCELDKTTAVNCALDFLESQIGREPTNFKDWLIWKFGRGICNTYLIPYNEKIWRYPLDKIETGWIRGKMPVPDKKDFLWSLLSHDSSENIMPHSIFYYPSHGGIQSLVNAIAAPVNILFNQPVESIEFINDKYCINGTKSYDFVICTLPLPSLATVLKVPSEVLSAIKSLKWNPLTTLLFESSANDWSWIYIPDKKYLPHRVCFQRNLSPYACPTDKSSGTMEIIGRYSDVSENFAKMNLPPILEAGDVIDCNYTRFAYVIHDFNYKRNMQIVHDYFSTLKNFKICGRWGSWNYNNMDVCMKQAFDLVFAMNNLSAFDSLQA